MFNYECSGRSLNGTKNIWGCRKKAIGGFVCEGIVWLFCGQEHDHPSVKPMNELIFELLQGPRKIGDPLPT